LLLGVSRSTAYELVRSGELESVQLRRRVVVPVAAIAERLGITVPDSGWHSTCGPAAMPSTSTFMIGPCRTC
jgi:excisionase family DNA binding protein